MQKRRLGNTDLELTTVGLGAWAMGGPWLYGWGPQDDDESIATILRAMNEGINWIDTAAIYGHGRSEAVVGRALKQMSRKPLVATKCGLCWDEQNERIPRLKAQSIRTECHDSLRRLGIDTIDLYQIHWNQPEEDIEEGWTEMARLVKEGKVRYIGVSNFDVEQIQRLQKIHPVASLQPPYSMLHREAENELLDYCGKNQIGVVAYSPIQRGLLTGKFDQARFDALAPDDHRRFSPDFLEPQFSATLELVEDLKKIAGRNGRTCAELAISWVLRRDEVTAAIVGARSPQQIIETAPAADWELSKKDIEEIERLLAERDAKVKSKIK
ncbi:MAG: aldo/keto reductase [Sedimentisphaerales bacterium]|nr:aldo/keto reductase [Sedimentisphaerales bacterium]